MWQQISACWYVRFAAKKNLYVKQALLHKIFWKPHRHWVSLKTKYKTKPSRLIETLRVLFILRRRRSRKRLVVSQRRYEGACNRIADANVTFCERGAAADNVKPYFWYKKMRRTKRLAATWERRTIEIFYRVNPEFCVKSLRSLQNKVQTKFRRAGSGKRTQGEFA